MTGICAGRVVIVTGAGRGIGRSHALEFARQGATVVVNDLGVQLDGSERGASGPAEEVVAEIEAMGGEAVANGDDVADWTGAERLVAQAVDTFGSIDTVVNNAGFVRDRMFANTTEDEWDAVVNVHLKGHFCVARHAAAWWRSEAKAGRQRAGRIVNTSSGAGLLGSVGQASYSAAKAGIVGLTLVQSAELGRYGATANAIAPVARTRMTEEVFADDMAVPDNGFDAKSPDNVAPVVVWLGSDQSAHVTGRVFEIDGGQLTLMDGFRHGPARDKGDRWDPAELGAVVDELTGQIEPPEPVFGAG
ncbi:MAG: SDR family oxidoreductase [Acidimicrobiales bacterium]|nr:SDR family oxidoreductase [Acidimicrobiales bacterium]